MSAKPISDRQLRDVSWVTNECMTIASELLAARRALREIIDVTDGCVSMIGDGPMELCRIARKALNPGSSGSRRRTELSSRKNNNEGRKR